MRRAGPARRKGFGQRVNKRRLVALIVGTLSSVLFLALAFRNIDYAKWSAALGEMSPWPWAPLAVLSYVAGHFLRGLRCRKLLSNDAYLSVPRATSVVVLGYAANNVLPARLGELVRAGMLSKEAGVPALQALSVTLLERILDGLALLLLLLLAALRLPRAPLFDATLGVGASVFGLASGAVLLAVLAPRAITSLASRTAQLFGARVHDRVVRAVTELVMGVSYLRTTGAALGALALSVGIWVLEGGMFLLLLPAFGLAPDPFVAAAALCVTNLGILAPSTPGFIGTFHFFCMTTLVTLGVSEAVALSYATVVHLSFFVPVTLWGVAIATTYGISLTGLAAQAARAEPWSDREERAPVASIKPTRATRRPPSPELALLCAALIPIDDAPEASREEVLADVTRFVESELADLPGHLPWLMALGLAGFRGLTALRFLRPLQRVPADRLRPWVEAFAYGKVPPVRQFFRALRSVALIAFYEHEVLRRELRGATPARSLVRDRGERALAEA